MFCLLMQPMDISLHAHVEAEKVLGIKAKASLIKKKVGGFHYSHQCPHMLVNGANKAMSAKMKGSKKASLQNPPCMRRCLHTPPGKALPTPESSAEIVTENNKPHGLKHNTRNMLSSCGTVRSISNTTKYLKTYGNQIS